MRDLGSTNGTWANGRRLAIGTRVQLRRGATIAIGEPANRWTLVDARSPIPRARELRSGRECEGTEELLHLPSDEAPLATVLDDGSGWALEQDGELHPVADGDVVQVDTERWVLELPAPIGAELVATTEADVRKGIALERARLSFRVSRDEEYVELTVADRERSTTLPARGFHYTLLTLARRRLADAASGLDPAEHGWVYADELARQLAATKPKVNLDICRARQQLADYGILGAARIIERRPTTHQLRIGPSALEERAFDEDV